MSEAEEKLKSILGAFREVGCSKVLVKELKPNDNSKNQIYLGGIEALNLLPATKIQEVKGTSQKPFARTPSKRSYIVHCFLDFYWLNEGKLSLAPTTKLILYPQYPEARLSGFLAKCPNAPSKILNKRLKDRILFLGVTDSEKIIGHVIEDGAKVLNHLQHKTNAEDALLIELQTISDGIGDVDSKGILLRELESIFKKGWIKSKKLNSDGSVDKTYVAQNAGGYTLEAELGVKPNGNAKPDYLGWEIKQHQSGNVLTLFTPEPDGGFYKKYGVRRFIEKYGYKDKNGKPNRLNFGGTFMCNIASNTGNITLKIMGFSNGKITSAGKILLLSHEGEEIASWSFTKLMEHWNKKHNKVAYVEAQKNTSGTSYKFGPNIYCFEGTSFDLFLNAVLAGKVYLDPGLKLEDNKTKARNQFRIRFGDLGHLYKKAGRYTKT